VPTARPEGEGAREPAPSLVRPQGLSLGDELFARHSADAGAVRMPLGGGVFAKRAAGGGASPTEPRMAFGNGWEARMFSGVDTDYGSWRAGGGWSAEMFLEFDAQGVPVHMMLTKRTGDEAIDKRLLQGAYGWRLRDAKAPWQGTVSWSVPATAATAPSSVPAAAQEGAPADG